MQITIIGLNISSSIENALAANFRGLTRELSKNGHEVLFLEQAANIHEKNRFFKKSDFCTLGCFESVIDLKTHFTNEIATSNLIIVGSNLLNGDVIGNWVCDTANGITAFYDLETPMTLEKLERGDYSFLTPDLIPKFDIYLSIVGGPILNVLEQKYHSPMARVLYCSVDTELFFPKEQQAKWDLGFLGNYGVERQTRMEKLMLSAARQADNLKFVVSGQHYPLQTKWPANVNLSGHTASLSHRDFINSLRFMLNLNQSELAKTGYAPNDRLFQAAACGIPIISDYWEGLETIFEPGIDILISESKEDTLYYLRHISEDVRIGIGENGRRKVMARHTSSYRAKQLEEYTNELTKILV